MPRFAREKCESGIYHIMLRGINRQDIFHEKEEEISKTMKRIGVSYAWWYNWKYQHIGHVFQDWYMSETVNEDGQLLNVLRYIHNNPLKASLVKDMEEYHWSSCKAYFGEKEYPRELTDTQFVLGLLANSRVSAMSKLQQNRPLDYWRRTPHRVWDPWY